MLARNRKNFLFSAREVISLLLLIAWSTGVSGAEIRGAGELVAIRGEVEIARQGGGWQVLAKEEFDLVLKNGDAVRTGDDGWVAIITRAEGRIHLHRNTLLILKEVTPKADWLHSKASQFQRAFRVAYELLSGQAVFANDNPYVDTSVRTPTLKLGVQNTAFVLKVEAAELSVLEVLEGSVVATNAQDAGDRVRAPAGTQVVARSGERLQLSRLLISQEDAVQWTLFVPPIVNSTELTRLEEVNADLGRRVRQAYAAMRSGDLTAGKSVLETSTRAFPDYGTPWRLLALADLVLGNKDAAQRAAEAATNADPGSPASWIMLSYAFQAAHELPKAVQATRRALEIEPQNVLALTNMARLQFGTDDDPREAWGTLQQAQLALDGLTTSAYGTDQRSVLAAEIENLRGYLLLARQDTSAAVLAFQSAARQNSQLGEPYLGLAIAFMREGRVAEAMKAMATAVLLEPQRSLFYSYWGKMLHQVGWYDKALATLERAKRYDRKDPTPYLYEGLVLRDLNRPGPAVESLQTAIKLNDYRGVFRSRFLLDQDLAVRNVDLAVLFDELGLGAWAQQKATAAVSQDYTNYSAHNMLQGSLARRGRAWSQMSEALLARMLAPASVNSFNSYNQYTLLFEQPKLRGTVSVAAGNHERSEQEILGYGALPSWNLAAGALAAYSDTDGWRGTNGERTGDLALVAKWDPSPKDSFLITASHRDETVRDELFPRYEYDFPADPDDRLEAHLSRFELGYRHDFRPKTDLLLYVSRRELELDQLETNSQELFPAPSLITLESFEDSEFRRPYTQGQAQLMMGWDTAAWGDHQVILGTVHYWLDDSLEGTIEQLLTIGEEPFHRSGILPSGEVEPYFRSFYLLDLWKLSPYWSLEAGLYADRYRAGDPSRGTEWTVEKLNPRLGAVWRPSEADTVRLAAFRYLLPVVSARLDPTLVAGVPMLRDDREGSLELGGDLVWEHEWDDGLFTSDVFFRERELYQDMGSGKDPVKVETLRARRKGVELTWNQLVRQRFGLEMLYRYLDATDQAFPDTDRQEHLMALSVNYVGSNGLFGRFGQTYRHIWSIDEERPREDIFVTDLSLGYRFPGRKGELALAVRNLFDARFNWVTDRFEVFTDRAPRRELLVVLSLNF